MDILRPNSPESNPGTKTCTICKQDFPATTEYFHSNGKRGLYTYCKKCKSEKNKARYRVPENHEKFLADRKAYRNNPENREKIRATQKEWRDSTEGQEYRRSYTRQYRTQPEVKAKRSEEAKTYMSRPEARKLRLEREREYYTLPEKREAKRSRDRVMQHKRRANKRQVQGSATPEQIQGLLKRQKRKCYYCQVKFEKKNNRYIYHVDHTFPLSRVAGTDIPANSIDYLVLTCPTCNMRKNDKFPWEFPEGGRLL